VKDKDHFILFERSSYTLKHGLGHQMEAFLHKSQKFESRSRHLHLCFIRGTDRRLMMCACLH